MRNQIIKTLKEHFEAQISKHVLNIEIMLENPRAIPEHTDFVTAIEEQLGFIAEFQDKFDALESYIV
jgi:hypothetical protein